MIHILNFMKKIVKFFSKNDGIEFYNSIPIKNSFIEFSDLKSNEIIFLVSPGRSGTKTLIQYLRKNSDLCAIHAPTPWLATVGSFFWKGEISEESAGWAYYSSRENYLKIACRRGLTFVDGDCKNLPLLPVLADFFPKSKFVHVVRNPLKFVCSGLDRGYYEKKDPVLWGHLLCDSQVSKADSFKHQVELIADFWEISNNIASEVRRKVGKSRYVFLKSESMFIEGAEIYEAFNDLGVGNFSKSQRGPLSVSNSNNLKNKYDEDFIVNIIRARCPSAKIYYPEIFK